MSKPTKPLVSIIMPMYNQERYIEKCLASVMAQSLKNIEIIVVNDGSTDSSMDIVRKMAEKDTRIKVIDKVNTGYGNSVNVGLENAVGDYIGIVETDDFVDEKMYQMLYDLTDNGKVDIVKGNFYDYYEYEKNKFEAVINNERESVPVENTAFNLRQCPQILWGHPSVWSAIYRREFLLNNNIKMKEVKGGGWVDNPFFFETLCKATTIKWTSQPLYYYRKTNANPSLGGIVNPNLPFDRMNDNMDIIEENGFTDDETLKRVYARALMYATGAFKECNYNINKAVIDENAQKLMRRCDGDIFRQHFNAVDNYTYYSLASPINAIRSKFPKILIYNWLPYDNPWNWGGGVTVYCKNLIDVIVKKYPFAQVYFLSSGFAYMGSEKRTFIRRICSLYGEGCYQYEIVNSPVPAAQENLLVNPLVALENRNLKDVFKEFLQHYGPFNVIHFNNIEGLSLDVLDLKKDFPDTRFIFSIHNYVPMCATGSYYQRHNHCNCSPAHTGKDCMLCTRKNIKRDVAHDVYNRSKYGINADDLFPENEWLNYFGFRRLDDDADESNILQFSETATRKLNENCDSILAVSKRVYDIAAENGFDTSKMSVSYIGTKVARRQVRKSLYPAENGLKIVFLGNFINYEEKGFPFLLDALGKLDDDYASKIDMVLTARDDDNSVIYKKLKKFRSVKVYHGYTHADLQKIFEGCNLSIVPVLWEDNLPQIAIESVAYGVPVLASSCGGPSELTDCELFRFEGGNEAELLERIKHFVDNPQDLNKYWEYHHGLKTMEDHWNELLPLYGLKANPEPITLSMEDFAYLWSENRFLRSHTAVNRYGIDCEEDDILRFYGENKETLDKFRKGDIEGGSAYIKATKVIAKLFPFGSLRYRMAKKLFGKKDKRQKK